MQVNAILQINILQVPIIFNQTMVTYMWLFCDGCIWLPHAGRVHSHSIAQIKFHKKDKGKNKFKIENISLCFQSK